MSTKREIWIGFAEASPLPGESSVVRGKGAFVSVLGWATSADVFWARVARSLRQDHQLELVEFRWVEPFSAYIEKWESSEEILTIYDEIVMDSTAVRYSTFHWWMNND